MLRKKLSELGFQYLVTGQDSEGFDTFVLNAGNIQSFGDPSVKARQESTSLTLQEKYEEQGFPIELCDSHNTIVVLDKIDDAFERQNIEVDEQCEPIIDAGRYWEWPKDRQGVPKPGATQPAHSEFCLSEDTEILTSGGFVKMLDMNYEKKVANYHPDRERLVWYTIPKNIIIREFNGQMISIKGKTIDQLITPNHKVLFYRQSIERVHGKKKSIHIKEICQAVNLLNRPTVKMRIPGSASCSWTDAKITDDEIKIMAWMITEFNPVNENIITLEAPTASAGVGIGVTRARVDEAANVDYLETIHTNLSQSCRENRHYISYPVGRGNFFATLHFTAGHFDFEKVEIHRKENPNYDDKWYALQKKRLTSFYIAQRIDISFEDSAQGRVWEKFSVNNIGQFEFVSGVDVYLFWDFGFSDFTSVGFICRISETKLRIFDWLQVNHKGYREISLMLRKKLSELGFQYLVTGQDSEGFDTFVLNAGNIQSFGDPSVKARRESTSLTLQEKYEEQGFPIELCDSHNTIVVLDKIDDAFERQNIEVDELCEPIIDAGRYWEWPKDKQKVPKPGATQPAHSEFSHAGKALEYGFVMTLMNAGVSDSFKKYQKQSEAVRSISRPVLDFTDI